MLGQRQIQLQAQALSSGKAQGSLSQADACRSKARRWPLRLRTQPRGLASRALYIQRPLPPLHDHTQPPSSPVPTRCCFDTAGNKRWAPQPCNALPPAAAAPSTTNGEHADSSSLSALGMVLDGCCRRLVASHLLWLLVAAAVAAAAAAATEVVAVTLSVPLSDGSSGWCSVSLEHFASSQLPFQTLHSMTTSTFGSVVLLQHLPFASKRGSCCICSLEHHHAQIHSLILVLMMPWPRWWLCVFLLAEFEALRCNGCFSKTCAYGHYQ